MKYRNKPFWERNTLRAKKRRACKAVTALLCAIVIVTLNRLAFRANALEHIEASGLAEHVHTEVCYDEAGALITNTRKQRLSFMKVDIANAERPLSGATFDLYRLDAGERVEPALMSGMTSGEDGLLSHEGETIFELEPGTYQLVETRAPSGYTLRSAPIVIAVETKGVQCDAGTDFTSEGTGGKVNSETGVITLLITNTAGAVLPATGGSGIIYWHVAGAFLIIMATCVLTALLLRRYHNL